MKDYLSFENARNKTHAALYERLIKLALGRDDVAVLVGHHLTFELDLDGDGRLDIESMNEVPSADCLMFDHDIMLKVFGNRAFDIMRALATTHCDKRDDLLAHYLSVRDRDAALV